MLKKISKGHQKEIMRRIREAGDSNNYETTWDMRGVPDVRKKKSNIKKGRHSRAAGGRFELKVRKDLESKGRIVDKWNNNVNLDEGKIVIAKKKFNPFLKVMTMGTGFPDFISIKYIQKNSYSVIGVEVKMNGILSKIEKEKCVWYLKNKIFSEIWIAKKGKKRGSIEYIDFREKFPKFFQ